MNIFQEAHDFLDLTDPIIICIYLRNTNRYFLDQRNVRHPTLKLLKCDVVQTLNTFRNPSLRIFGAGKASLVLICVKILPVRCLYETAIISFLLISSACLFILRHYLVSNWRLTLFEFSFDKQHWKHYYICYSLIVEILSTSRQVLTITLLTEKALFTWAFRSLTF